MSSRRSLCLALIVIGSLVLPLARNAPAITVKPASFDHVEASIPQEVMAGVEFEVVVTFVDRFGNPMPEGWRPPNSFGLSASQPASILPPLLTPKNYMPGFRFRVSTEKVGRLDLTLSDEKGKTVEKWQLAINSGRPEGLSVTMDGEAEVGQTTFVRIRAVDRHGNPVSGYEPERGAFTLEGAPLEEKGDIRTVDRGTFELPISFRSSGQFTVTVRDRRGGLNGVSGTVKVSPAPLASFDVAATPGAPAGEPVLLNIRAVDRFGNTVTDYASRYKGVRLFSGTADIVPDLAPPSSFSEGVAQMRVTATTAGKHVVQVSEIQSNLSSRFELSIAAGPVARIQVTAPDSAVAGEPFPIAIVAMDDYGNRVSSLPQGAVVLLESTGSGRLDPDRVAASSFTNGAARIMVTYQKAEAFDIQARLAGREQAAGPAPVPKDDEKTEAARKAAERAREEAMRARREARLRDTKVSERPATPAPRKPPAPVPAPEPARPSPVQAAPAPRKAPSPPKEAEKEPVREAARKPLRPGVIDRVGVRESVNSAVVTFSTNGITDYTVTTNAKLSRKWIDIEFPNVQPDLPERIEGGEKIVGEVYVEKPRTGKGVRVSVEILPVRIGYDVYQEGDSLILKVTKQ
ncbi:MAG: hypothetical protein JSV00_04310 [bacterium]|nr:MAG: hypothetical protein JSV00_04310 [bacterium]